MNSDQVQANPTIPVGEAALHYQVTPCIVVGAGPAVAERFDELRSSVETWLGQSFPAGGVRWGVAATTEDVTPEWADALIEPLLDFRLWLYLREREYVDTIPGGETLAPLRVYVLHDPAAGDVDADLLTAIGRQLTSTAIGRASLRQVLMLLLLSDDAGGAIPKNLFQETYLVARVGRGGLSVPPEHLYQLARIALHALVASEAGDIAGQFLTQHYGAKTVPLMGLGVSAITTALAHMREYRAAKIHLLLLRPYTGALTVEEQNKTRDAGRKTAQEENSEWRKPTLKVLRYFGWADQSPQDEPAHMTLTQASPLYDAVWNLTGSYVDELTNHLVDLEPALREEFDKECWERLEKIGAATDALIDEQLSRLALDEEQDRTDRLMRGDLGFEKAAALARVLAWFDGFRDANPEKAVVSPAAAGIVSVYAPDPEGWRKHARTLYLEAQLAHLHLRRLREETGTVGQVALRVLVAWPLLATLISDLWGISPWLVWLGTFALLAIGATVGYFLWGKYLGRFERNLREQRVGRVRGLILGLAIYHANRENRILSSAALGMQQEVESLVAAFSDQERLHRQRLTEVVGHAASALAEGPFIEAYLYDLRRCDEWIRRIVRGEKLEAPGQEEEQDSIITALSEKPATDRVANIVRQVTRGQTFATVAAQMVHAIGTRLGFHEIHPKRLAAIELCDRERPLQDGNRWTWLYHRAHLMAGAGLPGPELTVVALGDRSDLAGADGRSNPQWRKDWSEARSRQPHRITMVRTFPLPDDYIETRRIAREYGTRS